MTALPADARPTTEDGPDPLLRVRNLTKLFRSSSGEIVRAVDDVSFDLHPGEALGLVGESGSGKSTTARCVLRLVEPEDGTVHLDGVDVLTACGRDLLAVRRAAQMVFQDPYSSLDPRMRVGAIVAEGMEAHGILPDQEQRRARVAELLTRVGLRPEHAERRPADFSGGQRQRIGIARALALEPRLLVCDEPIASLDVSIQAQVLNLLADLRDSLGLTVLFIAHDLATVRFLCDRIAVMRSGRICEIGTREQVLTDPHDAYTRELLAAVPRPDPATERDRRAARIAARAS